MIAVNHERGLLITELNGELVHTSASRSIRPPPCDSRSATSDVDRTRHNRCRLEHTGNNHGRTRAKHNTVIEGIHFARRTDRACDLGSYFNSVLIRRHRERITTCVPLLHRASWCAVA